MEVLRTDGDNHLGGEDFDLKIISWLQEKRTNGDLPCLEEEIVHEEAERVLAAPILHAPTLCFVVNARCVV